MLDSTKALDGDDVASARGKALRDAEQASLKRRAGTADSRALVNHVVNLLTDTETTRKRQRVSRAGAFRQVIEGFLGDLLIAKGEGGVYRRDKDPPRRHFAAARQGLKKLGLLEETKPIYWSSGRRCRRFKATPQLRDLAAQHGIEPTEARKHFIHHRPLLPEHPLRLRATSERKGANKVGREMEIDPTDDRAKVLEQTVRGLNSFLDQFEIRGGTHRGYERIFNCGDRPDFDWNLGGRLFSVGEDSYQGLSSAERLKMTIDGKQVCELDIRASTLTIFQSLHDQPFDFTNNPDFDPYALPGFDRDVVKKFIIVTLGQGQFPVRWPRGFPKEYREKTGNHPPHVSQVCDAVRKAYPRLAELRRDDTKPPIWSRLWFPESEAVLGTMVALQAAGIPSLSVHDSLIVQRDHEQMATDILFDRYRSTTGAIPRIIRDPATY